MKKIEFEVAINHRDDSEYTVTKCPYGKTAYVGSYSCTQRCEYNVTGEWKEGFVICNHP